MSLVIRQEQIDAFKGHMIAEFVERMVVHLPQTFPEQLHAMPEPELHSLVHQGIEKADGYGVVLETDVQRYLECMVMLNPKFDTTPETEWAGKILNDGTLTGTQKMDSIDNHMIFSQAE
jgi:hypothetical protein